MVSSGPRALSAGVCTPWSYTDKPGFLLACKSPGCTLSFKPGFFLFKTNDGGQHTHGSARAT